MIEKAIVLALKSDQGVARLVRNRVYPAKSPQRRSTTSTTDAGAFPHVTVTRISTDRIRTNDGQTGLCQVRLQIDCWGLTYEDAKTVAEKVRVSSNNAQRIDGFKNAVMAGLVTVQGCFLEGDRDTYHPPQHADDVGIHQCGMDAIVAFDETSS